MTALHLFDSEHGGKETNNYLQKYEVHQYYCFVFSGVNTNALCNCLIQNVVRIQILVITPYIQIKLLIDL